MPTLHPAARSARCSSFLSESFTASHTTHGTDGTTASRDNTQHVANTAKHNNHTPTRVHARTRHQTRKARLGPHGVHDNHPGGAEDAHGRTRTATHKAHDTPPSHLDLRCDESPSLGSPGLRAPVRSEGVSERLKRARYPACGRDAYFFATPPSKADGTPWRTQF